MSRIGTMRTDNSGAGGDSVSRARTLGVTEGVKGVNSKRSDSISNGCSAKSN